MHATLPLLENDDFPPLHRAGLEILQVNLGYRCNQQCLHCHVNAGPRRKEEMNAETIGEILQLLEGGRIHTLDLTGGAPELNPHFRHLVREARRLGIHVMDRCNLTILEEPGQEGLAEFLARQGVEIVASLPCYLEDNVNRQRGNGVFSTSIHGLQRLNALGYGATDGSLMLNLVYNPQGPALPPPQEALEQDYRDHLLEHYNVRFNHLYTLANMPIQRFGSMLVSKGQFDDYMQLLRDAYQPANLESVMCRRLISIDWQGYLYDCDFNQMLQLPMQLPGTSRPHVRDLIINKSAVENLPIAVRDHCYGCTAGQGSSCGGALKSED